MMSLIINQNMNLKNGLMKVNEMKECQECGEELEDYEDVCSCGCTLFWDIVGLPIWSDLLRCFG